MSDRMKLYPREIELVKMGFQKKGEGDDPRDFWHEIDLWDITNIDQKLLLEVNAYSDFTLSIPELHFSVPIIFNSNLEIETFISIFRRPIYEEQDECDLIMKEIYTDSEEPETF